MISRLYDERERNVGWKSKEQELESLAVLFCQCQHSEWKETFPLHKLFFSSRNIVGDVQLAGITFATLRDSPWVLGAANIFSTPHHNVRSFIKSRWEEINIDSRNCSQIYAHIYTSAGFMLVKIDHGKEEATWWGKKLFVVVVEIYSTNIDALEWETTEWGRFVASSKQLCVVRGYVMMYQQIKLMGRSKSI
jgi:hypothetical protein